MKVTSKFGLMASGAAAATLLILGTAASYPTIAQAASEVAALPGAAITATTPVTGTNPLTGTLKAPNQAGVNTDQYFADALGITVDELSAARVKAAGAALDEAVSKGYLTQQQADALRTQVEAAAQNGSFRLSGGRFGNLDRLGINTESLLADALGIDVDKLTAAEVKAYQTILNEQVTAGRLTQDQADLMVAREALQIYQRSQQKSYADQVADAVQAGAITQAQADLLLKNQPGLLNGFGLFGGKGGDMRGFGGQGFGDQGGMQGGRGMNQGGRGGRGFGNQGAMPGMPGMQGAPGMPGVPGLPSAPGSNNGQGSNNPQGTVPVEPSAGL